MTNIVFVGMPRAASTSIETYLGDVAKEAYLGKSRDNEFGLPFLHDLIRRDLFIMNRDAFFERYPPGSLARAIDELGLADQRAIICDEALSFGGVRLLGQQTEPFAEILYRLSRLLDGRVKFFMLLRDHISFARSFHIKLVSMGHFIPYQVFLRQLRESNLALHHLMHLKDRVADLQAYEHVAMTLDGFLRDPLETLHNCILGTPVPAGATFPHENKGSDPHALEARMFAYLDQEVAKGNPVPITMQMTNFYMSRQEAVGFDRESFFKPDEEGQAWLSRMMQEHFVPVRDALESRS